MLTSSPSPIHELTLAEFLGDAPIRTDIEVAGAEICGYTLADIDRSSGRSAVDILGFDLPDTDGYEFFSRKDRPTDVIAVYDDGFGIRTTVGDFTGENLFVEPRHRNKQVGSLLVILAAEARGGTTRALEYTPAGWKTHCRAHRLAVEARITAGDPVPAKVLAEYPDLVAR